MKLWSGSCLQIRWFVPSLELERGFKAAGSVERVEWRDAVGGFKRFNGLLMVHSEYIFCWSVRACYHQCGHGNVLVLMAHHSLPLWGPYVWLGSTHWCTGYCFCPVLLCHAWEQLFWIMSSELKSFYHNVALLLSPLLASSFA